ncbi:MAG: CPBP family intramembrane metalloprotease [Gammaproteobacteria bacterium]|nr:CPBP family intramembrane metalloprotease [Gammaproteobacteria bacterium]NIN62044.1 CPBP family intramembrane metalloprotease [Gammaproteobacteria bacterium]NIO62123.1 CPBP family intramembrane metalloprotease [Gammaproteobacteria bacterium]NIQ08267.1 CPBP family intramembrane metalloprotease [Gammaproteobacteria bacterium]NIQ19835.1 CPBP family intramembrane metalloprotease [Gammaproteobacteria bacterium]
MRAVIVLFLLSLLALVCGALFAYPAYWLISLFATVEFGKIMVHLSSLSGFLLILAYLRCKYVLSWQIIGYQRSPGWRNDILKGLAIGILIMLILEIVLFLLGIHRLEQEFGSIPLILLKALITGLTVGLIEETLYRGALQGALMKLSGTRTAILVSSLIYAAVHFLQFDTAPSHTTIEWHTGLQMLPLLFSRFLDPNIISTFFSLMAFGVFLSLVRQQKNTLYQCIGIHAGVVIAIKLIKKLTEVDPETSLSWLVSSNGQILGTLACIWLILVILFYSVYIRCKIC